jgi:Subtilisin inhibitor-like
MGDTGSAPAQGRYDLTITSWPRGRGGPSTTATLTCDPDGGTHPDPAKACAALLAHPEALHPVPLDMACTEIYGGDQVARIEGPGLQAMFNRTNGCEIGRWDALAPLLEIST